VQIVDDNDTPLPARREGIVRVKSETGVTEYLEDEEETTRVFRNGWFYPGDIGVLTADGLLAILGRATTVLNVGGSKLNPETIEAVLCTHSNVQQAAVFSYASERGLDELCALIVPRSALIADALKDFCRARLPEDFVPARFIAVSDLPRNDMGKIERLKLPELAKSKLN
jgi:acyl-CoA synthetase (AMP-forming)/AMP-acid ligase II